VRSPSRGGVGVGVDPTGMVSVRPGNPPANMIVAPNSPAPAPRHHAPAIRELRAIGTVILRNVRSGPSAQRRGSQRRLTGTASNPARACFT